MSQHDYVLDNQSGLNFRVDLNGALNAIVTNNSGVSEPNPTYAAMWWPDTTSGWVKQRNIDNNSWIKRFPLNVAASVNVASATTLDLTVNAVNTDYFHITGTTTITAVTLEAGQRRLAVAAGAFVLTHGAALILPGAANYTATSGDMINFIGEAGGVVRVAITPGSVQPGASVSPGTFQKADASSAAFTKTASSTLSIKAGTKIEVAGSLLSFATATAVVMPTLTAGSDYAIYACTDGTIRADANWSAPTGYTTANSRKIGGFHYGLVAPGTTLAGGSFNTSGSPVGGGMVWTQADVDKIAGIDGFSLWDLKYRPSCPDPRGFSRIGNMGWMANYLCSTDPDANGISKAGTNIASGTVLPKVPLAMGGNGVLTYSTLDWWVANEIARAFGCRLPTAAEFYIAAFGVTENQSIDATASTYPVTQRNPGYTSRYGIEQATGVHYTWGQDSAGSSAAWTANGGRGQSHNSSVYRVNLGGARTGGSNSGSRCSNWTDVASYSYRDVGLRAACDHVQLV